jgi:hypothetical protein
MTNRHPESATGDSPEDLKMAVAAYAQSEKVKSGLIWVCQVAELVAAMAGAERTQGLAVLKPLARMVADEAHLAGRLTADRGWHEIAQKINMALVMIDSGVPQETGFHLTQALTRVTRIGGQAAALLARNGLF